MSFFDYLNAINYTKKEDILENESDYNAFMVNRGLSYFPDTVHYANEMNMMNHLPPRLQFLYLINTVRSRKRFSKWVKKKTDSDLEAIMKYYGYNIDKAKSAHYILSSDQITKIKKSLEEGGTNG